MQSFTEKTANFIRNSSILKVGSIWTVIVIVIEVLENLLAGDIVAKFSDKVVENPLGGFLYYPLIIVMGFVIYAGLGFILGYVLQNPKPTQKRNALKALLVFGIGDAVIRLIAVGLTFLFTRSTSENFILGGLTLSAGIILLLNLVWLIMWTSILAKVHSVSWLKGCVGTLVASIILAIVYVVLISIGIGGAFTISGLRGVGM